jgi:hypothetical protein
MANRILAIEKENPGTAGYNVNFPFITYYLHTPYLELRTEDALRNFIQNDSGFLIVNKQHLNEIKEYVNISLVDVGQFDLKGKTYLLLLIQKPSERISDLTIG